MISDRAIIIIVTMLAITAVFWAWSILQRRRLRLIHGIYISFTVCFAIWLIALLVMRFVPAGNTALLQALDCVTQVATGCAALYLCIAIAFVRGNDTLPRFVWLLFVIPVVNIILCATNPLHHLVYVEFSIVRSQIEFGPFVIVTGAYSYLCILASIVILILYALRNKNSLYRKQCFLIAVSGIVPPIVSGIATFGSLELPITATALSFIPVLILNCIALFPMHLLDIVPVATQQVFDLISDCFLVLSDQGLVISFNKRFADVFGAQSGITINKYLSDFVHDDDVTKKTAVYNLLSAVAACGQSQTSISYEESAIVVKDGVSQKNYYVADVSPLEMQGRHVGFVIMFKDITAVRKSMQQLRESEQRMMEQERFAFLGQMMGGLAHNLKTPIMSISGCVSAAEDLITESENSIGCPVVTDDDFREIYGEMRGWLGKVRDSTAYMSDIITAIKGTASNVGATEHTEFTLNDLITRTKLLMRHEVVAGGCTLSVRGSADPDITIRGDINNLVQVLGNLVTNAVYAQKQTGGEIVIGLEDKGGAVDISVKDHGGGIPDHVKERLFREMVTSKGNQGSGLGLYVSNVVVRGKFGGSMWFRDNPEGGSTIGMTIPLGGADDGEAKEVIS